MHRGTALALFFLDVRRYFAKRIEIRQVALTDVPQCCRLVEIKRVFPEILEHDFRVIDRHDASQSDATEAELGLRDNFPIETRIKRNTHLVNEV